MASTTQKSYPICLPTVGEEEYANLKDTILSGWITQGPKVREFETQFSSMHGCEHGLAVTSCTTGLHLILAALGIGPGDEVIVPAFTWVATANVVEHCGATPVLADIDLNTYNISAADVAKKITANTKAIYAVDLFGLCADYAALKAVAGDIPILEDAACAAGSASPLGVAGSLGLAAAFSFHPRKTLSTGEGGMVTTNDKTLAERMDIYRNHGASMSEEKRHNSDKPYVLPDFDVAGYNYRMTDIQANIGLTQLGRLNGHIAYRQEWSTFYDNAFSDLPYFRTPQTPEGYTHSWQSYVCQLDETQSPITRNVLMERLKERGVSTRPGTHAVHMLGYYRNKYDIKPEDYPNAFAADQYSISIPMHNRLDPEDFEEIQKRVHDAFKGN